MNNDSRALRFVCDYIADMTGECPLGVFNDDWIYGLCNCEKCEDNAKHCWREYFRYKAKVKPARAATQEDGE